MDRFLTRPVGEYGGLFDGDRYPATSDDIVAEFGDLTVEHPDGSRESLAAVVERVSPDTFETPEEARDAILSAVSRGAVGRPGYTDRDPPVPGTLEFAVTQVSF